MQSRAGVRNNGRSVTYWPLPAVGRSFSPIYKDTDPPPQSSSFSLNIDLCVTMGVTRPPLFFLSFLLPACPEPIDAPFVSPDLYKPRCTIGPNYTWECVTFFPTYWREKAGTVQTADIENFLGCVHTITRNAI